MSFKAWIRSLAVVAMAALATGAQAQQLIRIGTGGTAGTYYPVGNLIAQAISEPGQVIATAIPSSGAQANISGIQGGSLELGFTQSDVAYWAYSGTGIYQGATPATHLRLIATLYPESIHLVVRKRARIASVANLRGKRVAVGERDSGTLADVRLILAAYGMSEDDVRAEYLSLNQATSKLRDGDLDAFFFVGGTPTAAIADLTANDARVDLVSLVGPEIDKLRTEQRFVAADVIPAETYRGIAEVKTIAVAAQLVVSDAMPEAQVYGLTRRLFSEEGRKLLAGGHAKAKLITPARAATAASIPFHPGAERFYREAGLLK